MISDETLRGTPPEQMADVIRPLLPPGKNSIAKDPPLRCRS